LVSFGAASSRAEGIGHYLREKSEIKPIALGIVQIAIHDYPGWSRSYSEEDGGGGAGRPPELD
jgi:hypothetical protein